MEPIHVKIKELRKRNEMTLKALSQKTHLSISFLSQIERGDSSLAITSLKKIADAFQVPMSFFFEERQNNNYAIKEEDQKPFRVEGSGSIHVRLAGNFPDRRMEPMKVTLAPFQNDNQKYRHPGEEFYYVLKGAVIFTIENKKYSLKKGDSIHFPSTKMHEWKNPSDEETVLLSILTPVLF